MDYIEQRIYGSKPGKTVAIVGCVHGCERIGQALISKLHKCRIEKGILRLILANPKAYKRNKYFLEKNLNASFPGILTGAYEERLAYHLTKDLSDCDIVIDIHSISASSGIDTCITTVMNRENKKVMNMMNIRKILYANPSYIPYARSTLINHVKCGISLEYYTDTGKRKALHRAVRDVYSILGGYKMVKVKKEKNKIKKELFLLFDTLLLPSKNYIPNAALQEGRKIKKNEVVASFGSKKIHAFCDFYPVLLKKKLDTQESTRLCFMAQKSTI
ncbi:MAG: succinylglutamate desuccinylase/aspartoacylase family protein [Candidatus Pacebacteria bacterium]|jgi:predicted deacylase|nr:succinylglutamate desuccinylase/aspartoacylase family protein [Candidatus Paceibacterota bacterium]